MADFMHKDREDIDVELVIMNRCPYITSFHMVNDPEQTQVRAILLLFLLQHMYEWSYRQRWVKYSTSGVHIRTCAHVTASL